MFINFINSSDRNVTAIALNDDNYKFLFDEMIYNSFTKTIKVNNKDVIWNLKQEELKYLGFDFNFNQDIYLNSNLNQELNDYIDNLCDNVKELILNAASEKEEADLKMYNSSLEQLKFSEVEREFIVLITPKNEMIGFAEFDDDYLKTLGIRPKFQHLGYGKLIIDALKYSLKTFTLHSNDDFNYEFYLKQGGEIIDDNDDEILK